MSVLKLQRIPFTFDADVRLRMLKGRTGITPNILCRIGFCLSLEEPGIPKLIKNNDEIGREINRYTLLHEYDLAYTCLMVTWFNNKLNDLEGSIEDYFIAHMNRGVEILNARIKSLGDIANFFN